MKGPMKGATIGHSKQRIRDGRYIGLTEPGIIAAEPPNPIVNQLVIMPDIEKRLEAFVRMCHGIIVFPGGAGTAEEILYLLGILLDPANASQPLPLVFTGPRESAGYFRQLDRFISLTLGEEARKRYRIIVDDPPEVAREMQRGFDAVRRCAAPRGRRLQLQLAPEDSARFPAAVRSEPRLNGGTRALDGPAGARTRPANLRRAFSGIVAGNVKGAGHQTDRRMRPVRDPCGARNRKASRRAPACLRCGTPHETGRRIPPELPHRLIAPGCGKPPRDL